MKRNGTSAKALDRMTNAAIVLTLMVIATLVILTYKLL